jgi:hypothetical protein
MTVTFAVPLNAYAVEWTQPDGQPIQHRKEGEPVQGELAFDPFALMDEQPDSAHTVVNLRPILVTDLCEEGGVNGRKIEGPHWDKPRDFEYIGPCGFPCGALHQAYLRLKTTFSLATRSSPSPAPTHMTPGTAFPTNVQQLGAGRNRQLRASTASTSNFGSANSWGVGTFNRGVTGVTSESISNVTVSQEPASFNHLVADAETSAFSKWHRSITTLKTVEEFHDLGRQAQSSQV